MRHFKEVRMGNVLPLASMIAGLGAGAMSFVASTQQPSNAPRLRRMGLFMFAFAGAMGLLLVF
jgi:Ca2+/Na+ antiporter